MLGRVVPEEDAQEGEKLCGEATVVDVAPAVAVVDSVLGVC